MSSAALITKHRELALGIARGYRVPRHIERAELEHLALMGLWEWTRRHPDDTAEGWRFGAVTRIRGAIQDDMRRQDFLPRRARKGANERGEGRRIVSMEEWGDRWEERLASSVETPEDYVARTEAVAHAFRAPLIERDREIIRLRYMRGLQLAEIAQLLGTSEPRAHQAHARGMSVLRAQLDGDRAALRIARKSLAWSLRRNRRRPVDTDPPSGIYPKETRMPVPVPASAPLPVARAVTSTLPDEGLDMVAELARYQAWLVDQALIRTSGNRARAAKLLGINRTTLVEMLRRGSGARQARGIELREQRASRRAAGLCWICGVPLDGPLVAHGDHAGERHSRCATCRERRRVSRAPRPGTLNAHPKNDHR